MTRTLLPIAGLALLLSACASRPPEPTADTTAPRANAAANAPAPASRAGAESTSPGGSNAASNAARTPTDRSVYFAFDSDALSPKAQQVIMDNARYEQAQRDVRLRLEGNADERGSREYNLALGQRRAEAVRKAMQLDGMPSGEMEAISYGEERPRCSEHTEDCWAENRRVDIVTR
jgi:peptidoglycan-associated lipoprotein